MSSSYGSFPPPPGPPGPPSAGSPLVPEQPLPPDEPAPEEPAPDDTIEWQRPALFFGLSVISIFLAGSIYSGRHATLWDAFKQLYTGWAFAVPLLAILLAHEFGHYIAARLHRVPASLPYFLPLPIVSPFGTLGAVIAMSGRIRSRNALLDIGASGPLAGMVLAIPVLAIGLANSPVEPVPVHGMQEGQCLLYWALKLAVVGPIPPGHDVILSPTALAGWAGFLITMLNLFPWGQLDGGHIAFALFGPRQNRAAHWLRAGLLALVALNFLSFAIPIARGQLDMSWGRAIMNSSSWLVWWVVLGVIGAISGSADHPPFEPGPLSPARKVVAAISLVLFVLLFMPRQMTAY
jgi:membrane-associated protease RseP (regulator of RpoE activity)